MDLLALYKPLGHSWLKYLPQTTIAIFSTKTDFAQNTFQHLYNFRSRLLRYSIAKETKHLSTLVATITQLHHLTKPA